MQQRILTLLVIKNGVPAAVIGSLVASASCLLCILGLLPVGDAEPPLGPMYHPAKGLWCLGTGSAAHLVTLFCWRPRSSIFLDRICIQQNDARLQQEGVLSIGAFLKTSEGMLVLWDATYVQRLWCMFEVAAFLKSRPEDDTHARLSIVPTHLGPLCMVILFIIPSAFIFAWILLAYGSTGGWQLLMVVPIIILPFAIYAISEARTYMRSVRTLQEQLSTYSLLDSRCSCCDHGHVMRGQPIPCDRLVIGRCIESWFGGVEAFENAVRRTVLPTFTEKFGHHLIPISSFLASTVTIWWGCLDFFAGFALTEQNHRPVEGHSLWWLITGFGVWLGALPTCCVCVLFLVRKLLMSRGCILDIFRFILLFALATLALCAMLGLGLVVIDIAGKVFGPAPGLPVLASISSSLQILIALVTWNAHRLRRWTARDGAKGSRA